VLNARGVIALGEELARGRPVILVEEVVDEVRGGRDQVGEKNPGGHGTHDRSAPTQLPGPFEVGLHSGLLLSH
jgi:hypothetical protein